MSRVKSLLSYCPILWLLAMLTFLFLSGCELLKASLLGIVIDQGFHWPLVVLFLMVYGLFLILQPLFCEKIKQSIQVNIQRKWLERQASLSIGSFQEKDVSDYLHQSISKLGILTDTYMPAWFNLVYQLLGICLASVYIALIFWPALLLMYGGALVLLVINRLFQKPIQQAQQRFLSAQQHWLDQYKAFLEAHSLLFLYQCQSFMLTKLQPILKAWASSSTHAQIKLKEVSALNSIIGNLLFFGLIGLGLKMRLSLGTILALSQASNLILMPLVSLSTYVMTIQMHQPMVCQLLQQTSIESHQGHESQFSMLEARHLFFQYPNHVKPILSDLSFTIHKGQKVLIKGASGVGKSTLFKILTRQLSSSFIWVDGKDFQTLSNQSLYQQMAVVCQEGHLLAASVIDNITLGRKGDYTRLLQSLHIDPSWSIQGLSGGQKQRVLLARALFGQPNWLLLDEPFSALDQESALALEQWVLSLECTVIMISHHTKETGYDQVIKLT